MKIKTPLQFETFRDGTCSIFSVKSNRLDVEKEKGVCFGNQVIGASRYFAARMATVKIARIIRIPISHQVSPLDNVVIDGEQYKIEQIQDIYDSCPPKKVLSLSKIGGVN